MVENQQSNVLLKNNQYHDNDTSKDIDMENAEDDNDSMKLSMEHEVENRNKDMETVKSNKYFTIKTIFDREEGISD